MPHVLVLRTDGISPSSIGDDELGGYLATRHLIDLGHTDIAVIPGPCSAPPPPAVWPAPPSARRSRASSARTSWIIETGFGIEDGVDAGNRCFLAQTRPTAVFAANDNLALGVMAAAHRHSLSIGDDLALVGYNDIPLAQPASRAR